MDIPEILINDKKIAYKGFDVDENNNLYCQPGNHKEYFKVEEIKGISGNLELCRNGIHFCWNLNDVHDYYNLKTKVICEIEVLGEVLNEPDMKKSCTDKIKIIRILTKEEVFKISNSGTNNTGIINSGNRNSGDWNSGNRNSGNGNSGDRNSGDRNSGNWNSGDRNSGDRNSGNRNSGDWNSGDRNSGDWNSGNRNSGDRNSGDWNSGNRNSGNGNSGDRNSGDWNSGNWNSGDRNSGDRNSGDRNSGNGNSGDRNSGNWNSGNWNSGDWNNGFFNTNTPKVNIFNILSDFSTREFFNSKYYNALISEYLVLTEWIDYSKEEKENDKAKELIGGYLKRYDYKDACKIWWDKLTEENKEIVKTIPNFNKEIFKEITGIEI